MEDCAPPPAGALPCFRFPEWEKPARQIWDDRCTAILVECGETRSNSDIVDLIEARIGMRVTYKTASERRAALGIDTRRTNNWTAPLRRWRPWSM